MPFIVFILDTSGSMSTRSHPKFSFFDYAKYYIESFIKGRSRNEGRGMLPIGRENDRYFLLTNQSKYPENVKIISEKNPAPVIDEIKKINMPYGCQPVHTAILDAFRVLHVNRAQTGIDSYGAGRAPQNSEQVIMILLTDGSGVTGIPADFKLQFDPPFLGSEMTREAFRWDQKLYTVVFRIPSTPYRPTTSQMLAIDIDMPNIEKLCSRTGGRSFSIVSVRQIGTSIDHILATTFQHRIGVRFDCLPALPGRAPAEESMKIRQKFKKILEKKPVTNLISRVNPQGRAVTCHWPIPESYFPMRNMDHLLARTAHPMILCAPEPLPLTIRSEIPVDKLELEPGGVSDIIMEMLQGRKELSVWTYIEGASNGPTSPFGCLRLNALSTGIILVLLPYNFPAFYPLVEEIVKEPHLNQSQVWRQKLDSYFQTVPYYYFNQMRVALEKLKVKTDITSSMSSMYAGQLLSNLNRLKIKAKEEWDQVGIASKLSEAKLPRMLAPSIRIERITSRSSMIGLAKADDEDNEEEPLDGVDPTPIYSGEFQIPLYPPIVSDPELDTVYKTPYSSSIEDMVGKLNRIQANIDLMFDPVKVTMLDMAKLGAKPRFNTLEELHNMPMKSMGEYEAYQAARIKHYGMPFKKIEEEKEKTHAFGNPYKLKGLGAGIDEVMDSAIMDNNSKEVGKRFGERQQGGGPPKRRRGPLGIDAFDVWRTRRSTRGSSVASDISDVASVLNDIEEAVLTAADDEQPTSSAASSDTETAVVAEMEGMHVKNGNVEEVKADGGDGVGVEEENRPQVNGLAPSPPAEIPTTQEMMTRKIRIGSIVRKPANHRAYDEIMELATGIGRDASEILMRYAMRESQRFKLKQLTERLEQRLKMT